MVIKVPIYLNKFTGEIVTSKNKSKYDATLLRDKSLFQVMQAGFKPIIFVKENEDFEYEGKVVDLSELNSTTLKKLSEEGYSLSENHSPNSDIPRQFKVCSHCLKSLKTKGGITRVNLDKIHDYFSFNRRELEYDTVLKCECGGQTTIKKFHKDFKHTDDIKVSEVIVEQIVELEETDDLKRQQQIEQIMVGRIFDINELEDVNDLENHEIIKTLMKYKDAKKIGYLKFKRFTNFFKSKEFEEKYNIRERFNWMIKHYA